MGYIICTSTGKKEIFEPPEHGVLFQFMNPCSDMGHEYAVKICPACGRDYCLACCGGPAGKPPAGTCPACDSDASLPFQGYVVRQSDAEDNPIITRGDFAFGLDDQDLVPEGYIMDVVKNTINLKTIWVVKR